MIRSLLTLSCMAGVLASSSSSSSSSVTLPVGVSSSFTFDIVVYASTPSGISAAYAAADGTNLKVAVVEPLLFIGGMGAAGGLGLNDQVLHNLSSITGLARRWCYLNGLYYTPTNATNCVHHPDNYVSEASYLQMMKEVGVTMFTGCYITSAARDTTDTSRIASITTNCTLSGGSSSTLFSANTAIIDASYDGDVMVALGGIDYTWGREANTTYDEPMAGIVWVQEGEETFEGLSNITAVDAQGNLLPGIEGGPADLPVAGAADDRLMAFQHRACLTTDTNNQVKFYPPPGYTRERYALLQNLLWELQENGQYPHGPTAPYFGVAGDYAPAVAAAGRHKIIVCCGSAAVMTDEPNLNRGWPNATWEQRQEMITAHTNYLMGFFYYLSNDVDVPDGTKASFSSYGLCADEWTTATPPHWPPQLYIRVSNRLIGDYVLTQRNMGNPQAKPDVAVSVAIWELDSHITSRWATTNPKVIDSRTGLPKIIPINEGFYRHGNNVSIPIGTSCGDANGGCDLLQAWYDVPYQVMTPKKTQCTNLLVPVAVSASYVAYTATRIETMFQDLGAAAGVAVAMVAAAGGAGNLAVQDVNITAIQETLQNKYQQRVKGPYWS